MLQILWDITPEPQYLIVEDFVRYDTITTIYHGCRFCEILHQNPNISWMQVAWDIITEPYLILVANATNGVSVKIFKWEEFFDNERKISHTVFNFTYSLYFYTRCVILQTVFNFTHSVYFYTQCVILHSVCNFTHSV